MLMLLQIIAEQALGTSSTLASHAAHARTQTGIPTRIQLRSLSAHLHLRVRKNYYHYYCTTTNTTLTSLVKACREPPGLPPSHTGRPLSISHQL